MGADEFEADSAEAGEAAAALGYFQGRYRPRREYGAVVVHITGSGPYQRLHEQRFRRWRRRRLSSTATLLDAAVATYRYVMRASAHYVVYGNRAVQLAPEDVAAHHVGSHGSWLYRLPEWLDRAHYRGRRVNVDWWGERWGGLASPLDLARGKLWGEEYSANGGSVGVEIVWPHDDTRSPPSETTYETVARLVKDICNRREIPLDLYHVITHSDAHPAARSARGRPWDTPPTVSTPAKLAQLLGVPPWDPPPAPGEQRKQ